MQDAKSLSRVDASASGKDSIDTKQSWERQLVSLDLGNKALVFMRADVDEGAGRETFYVGRRAIFDERSDPVVIAWTSSAAVKWRLTSRQEPGDVQLLRQIVCDQRIVKRYLDLHGADGLPQQVTPAAEPQPDPAETQGSAESTADGEMPSEGIGANESAWRDPLLEELERARDGSMHDIVETIQRDQLQLVTEQPAGVLIVQGGPGTGKTAVGMHRVTWLLDNNYRAAKDVLVIGPNRSFLDYVGVALSELGTDGVTMLELPSLWSAAASPRDPRATAAVKSDLRMATVLRRAVDGETTTSAQRLEALVGGTEFTFELNRREVSVPVVEIAAIAGDALAGDSPYRVRREGCAQRITQHLTDAYTGLLPGPADIDYFSEIRRSRPVSRLLKRICPDLAALYVLRGLLSNRATLARAADGILSAAEQSLFTTGHAGTASARSQLEHSREELVCLDELEYVLTGRPAQTYGHVVVDEAQDITPLEARSLARRCPGGSMTILGDLAQSTGPHLYESWEVLGSALAGKDGWRVAELLTGFRVPREVMSFVAPLGAHCAPSVTIPQSVRETAESMVVIKGAAPVGLAAEAAENLLSDRSQEGAHRSVAVIVPQSGVWNTGAYPALRNVADADPAPNAKSAVVLTPGQAKGLEFDHVIVVEPGVMAQDEPVGLRHLYVALTRCTRTLTVVHSRPLPSQIGGASPLVPSPGEVFTRSAAQESSAPLCGRYHADGTPCCNTTHHADTWCREPECGGFRTAEPIADGRSRYLSAPADARADTRLDMASEGIADMRVSSGACGSFVARHRGGHRESAVELHAMLPAFVERGEHLRAVDGAWLLELNGFRLVLSADGRTVTGYDTVHAERSFMQLEGGVPSRVGKEARAARRSALTAPPADGGPPLDGEKAVRRLDIAELHLSPSACIEYEHADRFRVLPDGAFVQALRDALAADLPNGSVTFSRSLIILGGGRFQWRLASDGRSLISVRPSGTEVCPGPAGPDSDDCEDGESAMPLTVPIPETLAGPDQPEALDELVVGRVAESRQDRTHEALRFRLLADLYECAADAGENAHIDAWCTRSDGTAFFEVLGDDGHTYSRIREAVLHLMEAAHLRAEGQVEHLVVVLREPPSELWIVDNVARAFSVGLAWREGDGWGGPAAHHILGRQDAAVGGGSEGPGPA